MTPGISRVATVASSGSNTTVKEDQGECTPMHQALTHPPHYQATNTTHKKISKMKSQHTSNYPPTRTRTPTKKQKDENILIKLTLTLTHLKMKSTTLKKMYTHSLKYKALKMKTHTSQHSKMKTYAH